MNACHSLSHHICDCLAVEMHEAHEEIAALHKELARARLHNFWLQIKLMVVAPGRMVPLIGPN
jgi:hypothetical protein